MAVETEVSFPLSVHCEQLLPQVEYLADGETEPGKWVVHVMD